VRRHLIDIISIMKGLKQSKWGSYATREEAGKVLKKLNEAVQETLKMMQEGWKEAETEEGTGRARGCWNYRGVQELRNTGDRL